MAVEVSAVCIPEERSYLPLKVFAGLQALSQYWGGTSWTGRLSRGPWRLFCKLASEPSLSSFPERGDHPAVSKLEAAMGGSEMGRGHPTLVAGRGAGQRFQTQGRGGSDCPGASMLCP